MSRQREGHGVCNQPTVRERQLWGKTGLEETRAERGSRVSRRSGGLESQVQLHFCPPAAGTGLDMGAEGQGMRPRRGERVRKLR